MQEDMLKQIIENTFARIACPLQGNGIYAELQNAINEAYQLGRGGDKLNENPLVASTGG